MQICVNHQTLVQCAMKCPEERLETAKLTVHFTIFPGQMYDTFRFQLLFPLGAVTHQARVGLYSCNWYSTALEK